MSLTDSQFAIQIPLKLGPALLSFNNHTYI